MAVKTKEAATKTKARGAHSDNTNEWLTTIERIGERSRKEHEDRVAALQAGEKAQADKLRKLANKPLLETYAAYMSMYDMDPRVRDVYNALAKVAS